MKPNIISHLVRLNHQFYQTFAPHFSATRRRIQPGVRKIIDATPSEAKILDFGCGNGELAKELLNRGYLGNYLGLDFSNALLNVAIINVGDAPNIAFDQANFADLAWDSHLASPIFDLIFSFAVFHHLPGKNLRKKTIGKIANHLQPGGRFIHSHWQFLNSKKLRTRIQPWNVIGLNATQVDEGDYLIDWRRGGYGLRYIHQSSEGELKSLAEETGFQVIDSFDSDGAEGNLGLYQVWEKCSNF